MRFQQLLITSLRRSNILCSSPLRSHHITALRPARYTTAAMSKPSDACCSIPPIISGAYDPKGDYKTVGGLKTYVTGPDSASEAILYIFDIFGYFPQTLQGADILATSDPERKYRVFIPDFFEDNPGDISWIPANTDEKRKALAEFFKTKADIPTVLAKVPGIVANAGKLAPDGSGFTKWAIIGCCWGAKVASLAAGQDNVVFKAAVQCHPALLDPNDAKQVTAPMAVLASKDEAVDAVKAYQENLKVPNYVETFSTQIHGWMAARSNLEDPEVRKEYERGYRTALDFLHEHL